MVLQRDKPIRVWGLADPGEEVKVSLAGKQASGKAGEEGRWFVELPAMDKGENLEMVVGGKNTVTLKNIVMGDVWVCGGQSNMNMPMNFYPRDAGAAADIKAADLPHIRRVKINGGVLSFFPEEHAPVQTPWKACSPRTAGEFTAAGFYFAREAQAKTNVPIGLLDVNRGGTIAEEWMPVGVADEDAQALLNGAGVKGGLCLVIGAKNASLATALAETSALYVQALQPDVKLAAAWGRTVAGSTNRESVGIRNAAFEADHYGSDLFNLIVVEDASALGVAKPADLFRVLTPRGCVAFRIAPAGFEAEAKALKATCLSAGPFQYIFKKPVQPVKWKPAPFAIKWSAGPRSQWVAGYGSFASGVGRFFYREWMEVAGAQCKKGRPQLFAPDEHNGRMLWTLEEPIGAPISTGLAADNEGRLFTFTGDGKLVCLDADTGKQRFVLMEKGAGGGWIGVYDNDRYVFACGKVFSAEDGKLLWTLPPVPGIGLPDCSVLPYCRYRVGPLEV
ncbi:MAG: PQQ-binding-like beta-propeller repeat protein, partial [Phycisphaerae bacterium]|nr:PQQ-binding-like beta-propeller repeat protein [Phycisphaerae bacterium]